MTRGQGIARYITDIIENGIQLFTLDEYVTVLCELKEPHFVRTNHVFTSSKQKGVFVYCPVHCDFLNCAVEFQKYKR
jgi:hypothetical protein